jgi:hypothetical protein
MHVHNTGQTSPFLPQEKWILGQHLPWPREDLGILRYLSMSDTDKDKQKLNIKHRFALITPISIPVAAALVVIVVAGAAAAATATAPPVASAAASSPVVVPG